MSHDNIKIDTQSKSTHSEAANANSNSHESSIPFDNNVTLNIHHQVDNKAKEEYIPLLDDNQNTHSTNNNNQPASNDNNHNNTLSNDNNNKVDDNNDSEGNAGSSNINVYGYYQGLEATINKIRSQREKEKMNNLKNKQNLPTNLERNIIGICLSVTGCLMVILLFFMFPRVPTWSTSNLQVTQLESHAAGGGLLSYYVDHSIWNGNWMDTGIDQITLSVIHQNTTLGIINFPARVWTSRSNNLFSTDFSFQVDTPTIQSILNELKERENHLVLTHSIDISANEVFRIEQMSVVCTIDMILSNDKPPITQLYYQSCEEGS